MIGIIISVLLTVLSIISFAKALRQKTSASYFQETDGQIRLYCYEDCKITIVTAARFYSKGFFQILFNGETLDPTRDKLLKAYTLNFPMTEGNSELNLVVFREEVLVVSGDAKIKVAMFNKKKERFYTQLCYVSFVLAMIFLVFTCVS